CAGGLGGVVSVDAGRVQAMGPGSVFGEPQQNSDTTSRLYDYGRPRELHIQEGLRATKEKTHAGKAVPGPQRTERGKSQVNLVTSPCFVVDKFKLTETWQFQRPAHARRSVWCLAVLRGCGGLGAECGTAITCAAGEAVVVPAAVERFIVKPQWELEFLCASLPAEKAAHPKTVLTESAAGKAQ